MYIIGWEDIEYVSLNNGVFLCFNCSTGIHQKVYSAEVSFIKPCNHSFNVLQMRILINGGNRNAEEFFEKYDLMAMSI